MTNEELAVLVQHGDQSAALQLWEQVKRLVKFKAMYRLPEDGHTSRVELDDLMQAGYIAMMSAVKDFNTESGYTFTTYLTRHLKSAFARELGIRSTRRDALLRAISMDTPQGSGNDFSISETLPAPGAETAFDVMLNRVAVEQAFAIIMKYVEKLDPQQSDVIKKLYFDDMTLREIADQFGVSIESIRQCKEKGLRRLRGFTTVRKVLCELYADEHTYFYLHIGVNAFQSGSGSAVELLTERRDKYVKQFDNLI